MDFGGAPVGTTVNPVGQGMQTLSNLIGIKQQQQALQTGVYQQQSAQAKAQQDQQQNQELQALSQFTVKAAHDPAYHNPDGSLNVQKYQTDAAKVAPTYGTAYVGQMTSNANAMVDNRKALLGLSNEQRKTIGNYFNTVATNPNATSKDFIEAVKQARGVSDDPGYQDAVERMSMSAPPVANMTTAQASAAIRQHAASIASQTSGESMTSPSTLDTGAAIQPGATNRYTGEFTPAGASIAKPPQSTLGSGGQILNRDPRTGALSLPPTAGAPGASNINQTRAQVETQQNLAAGVTARVQQAQAAANNTAQSQDALERARTILDKPDSLNTGSGFEWKKSVKNILAGAGIDTAGADDANTLVKNLARYEASRATQAGLGGTDAARELSHTGSPNVSLDNKALKGVITQSLATEKALAAYANIQAQTQDPQRLQANEAKFRSIPHLIEGYEYGLARNPQEADEFLKKHGLNKQQMAETRKQIKQFEGSGS